MIDPKIMEVAFPTSKNDDGLTLSDRFLGWAKLMSAMTYLDEERNSQAELGELENSRETMDAIDFLLDYLPKAIRDKFMLDRAWRWELPKEAIDYLNRGLTF